MLQNVKAVIFDLDGTLVDSMWIWKEVDIEYLRRRNIELPEDLQKDIEGMSFTETAYYFKERFNLPDTIDEIKKEWNTLAEDFYKHKIPLKAGVFEFVQHLKNNKTKIGIGTSNSRELATEVLKKNGIYHYFDTIRTSCEVKRGKPHPDVFLKVAEDLGVEPKECVVFEDTYAGVLAAKRAGMKVYAIYDELSLPYKDDIDRIADGYFDDFINIGYKASKAV